VKPLALKVIAAGRSFGPYLAIELLLPGGSLGRTAPLALPHVGKTIEFPGAGVTQDRGDSASPPVLHRSPQIGPHKPTDRRFT
jgi:hypothetical protein